MKGKEYIKRKHKCFVVSFAVLLIGILCSCGDNKVETIDDLTEDVQKSGEDITLKEKLGVPDEVEYSFVLDSGKECTFTPTVVMPDAISAGLYELEAVELTTNYMESICRAFFDNGEYEILWPSYIYSQEELQERYETYNEEIEAWDDDSYQSSFLLDDDYFDTSQRVKNYTEQWKRSEISNPTDHLVLYSAPTVEDEEGIQAYMNVNFFDQYKYVKTEGTIGGRRARFNFIYNSTDHLYHFRLDFDRDARDEFIEFTSKDAEMLNKAFVYTEEEAAQMALEYVEMLGLTDMGLINTDYLMFYDHEVGIGVFGEEGVLSGYRFTFGLHKNGVQMMGNAQYNEKYRGTVTIDIGAEGLESMYVRAPYWIVSNLTEGSELLTFAQINEIAETIMGEAPEYYKSIDKILFGYTVISYESGDVLVPAWRFVQWSDTEFESAAFTINAVDGSFFDDVTLRDIDTTYQILDWSLEE